MEFSRIIVSIIMILIIFLSLFLRIFIRYKGAGIKGVKEYLKILLIGGLCGVLIFTIYEILPKHEVGVDIIIKNENIIAEIYINNDFFVINENVNFDNIDNKRGFIAIKTEKNNKIIYYLNEKSIFKFNRKINIIINNDNIKIKSDFIQITNFIENHKNYDSILEILLRSR